MVSFPTIIDSYSFITKKPSIQASNQALLQLILFADDTNVFISHKDPDCLVNQLNTELNTLPIWFTVNKLSLNLKNTKFMVFKPSQKSTSQSVQHSLGGMRDEAQNRGRMRDTRNVEGWIRDENILAGSRCAHFNWCRMRDSFEIDSGMRDLNNK